MQGLLRAATLLVALALAGLCHLGCYRQSNPARGLATTSAAATAGGTVMVTPRGPFPRGQASPAHLPDPTRTGPAITILAPDRGAQVGSASTVDVRLRVVDPDGVAAVTVLGAPATDRGGGEWGATVALAAGLNLIEAGATDARGNRSSAYVSVTHGAFRPDDQLLPRTLALGLTPAGLRRLCDVAEQQTAAVQVYPLIAKHNPIVNTPVIKVVANGLTHDPLGYALEGAANGLQATVHMDHVSFDAQVDVIGVTIARAALTADRATAVVDATVDALAAPGTSPAKRALGLRVDRIAVRLDRFDVVPSSPLLAAVIGPFRGLIESAVRAELEKVLTDLAVAQLGRALPGLDAPLALDVPVALTGGRETVDVLFQVDEARGGATTGLELAAGLKATRRGPAPPGASRLVLVRGTSLAPVALGPEPFAITASADVVNGLLQALWLTGGLGQRIDGTRPYPQGTLALSARLLYPFLPVVRDLAPDPATPIVIELALGAAPLASFGGASLLEAQAGEVEVRLALDYMDGGPRAELFTLRAAIELGADLAVSAADLRVTRLAVTRLRADVIAEPTVDLADQEVVDFLQSALPTLADRYLQGLKPIPLPALPLGLTLTAPRLEVRPDVLVVRGGL